MRRDISIEIIDPIKGINVAQNASMIDPTYSPNEQGCNTYYGMVQKEYGTSLFCTGTVPGRINLLYQADFLNNSVLQGFSDTGMYQYSAGTFAADSPAYTGTTGYPRPVFKACMHNNAMIYCNGTSNVQYKSAYNATGTEMGGILYGTYSAHAMLSFKDHLNLYNTIEGGSACPKRVRWTKVGLLAYNTADWGSGTAGFIDIQDVEGEIMAAEKLGQGAVAVYGENSIHMQEWVGGSSVYQFTKMVNNIGLPSPRAIVSNDNVHYLATLDNIGAYFGGTEVTWIGDAIQSDYRASLNKNYVQEMWLQFVKPNGELRVYIPTGTATSPDTCYICKVNEGYAWHRVSWPYTAMGLSNRPSNLTIGDLVGNIGAQNWTFGDVAANAGDTVYLLGNNNGRVAKMDKTIYSIISGTSTGAAQTFTWDSKDISSHKDVDPATKNKYNYSEYMDNETRWQTQKIELKGYGSAYLSYSVDGGTTFAAFPESPVTLDANWKMHTLDVDICSPKYMFRVSNSSANEVVHMRYAKIEFVPGSEV